MFFRVRMWHLCECLISLNISYRLRSADRSFCLWAPVGCRRTGGSSLSRWPGGPESWSRWSPSGSCSRRSGSGPRDSGHAGWSWGWWRRPRGGWTWGYRLGRAGWGQWSRRTRPRGEGGEDWSQGREPENVDKNIILKILGGFRISVKLRVSTRSRTVN